MRQSGRADSFTTTSFPKTDLGRAATAMIRSVVAVRFVDAAPLTEFGSDHVFP